MYAPDRGSINGKPVYVNKSKDKVLAINPDGSWFITSLSLYWQAVKDLEGKMTGGYQFGGKGEPHLGEWKNYNVQKIRQVCG